MMKYEEINAWLVALKENKKRTAQLVLVVFLLTLISIAIGKSVTLLVEGAFTKTESQRPNQFLLLELKDALSETKLELDEVQVEKTQVNQDILSFQQAEDSRNQIIGRLREEIERLQSVSAPEAEIERIRMQIAQIRNRDFSSGISYQEHFELQKKWNLLRLRSAPYRNV
ncbi:hypothetical protein [Marinobacter changyiensis]|uniref:hypothetical protein n=1 Tax=Marinobacter changyiensis TaxID=2604091 RepID=UPI001264F815|nr:hypothetical protein [Marinobacter changyiensis]